MLARLLDASVDRLSYRAGSAVLLMILYSRTQNRSLADIGFGRPSSIYGLAVARRHFQSAVDIAAA
jgi:hypothetical protein